MQILIEESNHTFVICDLKASSCIYLGEELLFTAFAVGVFLALTMSAVDHCASVVGVL